MLNQTSPQSESAIAAAQTYEIFCDPNATKHQIKIDKDGGTSGTIALTAKVAGSTSGEVVYDNNAAAIVFNLASSTAQTYVIEGVFDSLILTPSTLNGTYKFNYCGW